MDLIRTLLFLPDGASSVADSIDTLHAVVISVTFIGWATLTLIGTWFVIRYRKREERQRTPHIEGPRWVEGTVIAGLLALFIIWWVVGFRQYVGVREPPRDALEIYVTAKQWMWKFSYPDGRATASELTVPVGKPVRLLMISRDVVHSFYVPAFRLKQDVVPGRYADLWFTVEKPGDYQVFCAELCGLEHSMMTAHIVALAPDDYDRWSKLPDTQPDATAKPSSMAERGEEIATRVGCMSCHSVDGRKHIGPTWAGMFGSKRQLTRGDSVLADETYITRSIMDPQADVVAGFDPVMPSYQGLIGGGEVSAVVAFIKSLRDSNPPQLIPEWNDQIPATVGRTP
jgi:cytochrome c oxidase subunit 2